MVLNRTDSWIQGSYEFLSIHSNQYMFIDIFRRVFDSPDCRGEGEWSGWVLFTTSQHSPLFHFRFHFFYFFFANSFTTIINDALAEFLSFFFFFSFSLLFLFFFFFLFFNQSRMECGWALFLNMLFDHQQGMQNGGYPSPSHCLSFQFCQTSPSHIAA